MPARSPDSDQSISPKVSWLQALSHPTMRRSTWGIDSLEIDGCDIPMQAGTLRVIETALGFRWAADLAFPTIISLPDPRRSFTVTIRTRAGLFNDPRVLRGYGAVQERTPYLMVLSSVGDDARCVRA